MAEERQLNFQNQQDETVKIKRKGQPDLLLPMRSIDRIIEMAWEDRTPFDAIKTQFGLKEAEVIKLMRRQLKLRSWRSWRARVSGRGTKHLATRSEDVNRFKSRMQRTITRNKISKR